MYLFVYLVSGRWSWVLDQNEKKFSGEKLHLSNFSKSVCMSVTEAHLLCWTGFYGLHGFSLMPFMSLESQLWKSLLDDLYLRSKFMESAMWNLPGMWAVMLWSLSGGTERVLEFFLRNFTQAVDGLLIMWWITSSVR